MTLSARNCLEGKIVELQLGGVMAHVAVRVGDNLIESVITKRSADEMHLKVGDTVSAIIKSTEVMLEKKYSPPFRSTYEPGFVMLRRVAKSIARLLRASRFARGTLRNSASRPVESLVDRPPT
jgi:molybdopterin-binding protein